MHPIKKICQIFNRFRKLPPPEPIHATGDKIVLDKGDSLVIDSILLEGYIIKNGVKIPYYHSHERGVEHRIVHLGDSFTVTWTFTTVPVPEPKK